MKKGIIAAVLTAAVLLGGCSANSETAIKVGDMSISKAEVSFLTDRYYDNIGDYDESKKYAVEAIKDSALLYQVAKIEGIDTDEDIVSQLKKSKASFMANYGGVSEYKKFAKEEGISDDFVDAVLLQEIYRPALEEKLLDDTEPTDDELKQYMQDNYIRAKHILLSVSDESDDEEQKAKAEKLLNEAKGGADFDKLISENSDDPGSTSYADGYVFTDGDMVSEFEEGAKSIQPGEFTMVKSSYGYHVIQRLPLDPSDSKFQSLFDEYKTQISESYENAKLDEKLKSIAEENGIVTEEFTEVIDTLTEPTPEPTSDPKDDPAYEDDGTTPKPAEEDK